MRIRKRPVRGWVAGVLGVAIAGSAAGVGLNVWVSWATRGLVFEGVESVPGRTVAIVLGARVYADGTPSLSLEDRLEAALALHRAGKVRKVLVSGDHGNPEYDEVNAMWRWMVEHGVPEEDLFLDHAGFRTLDTMERAARVFGVHDAVVCTQRYHLGRSLFLARQAGIDAVGVVADRRVYGSRVKNAFREFAARAVAVLDVHVLGTEPRHLGDRYDISGDGRETHDQWTRGDAG